MSTEERTALEGHLNPAPAGSPSRVMGLIMGVPIGFTALVVLNLALPGPAFLRVLLAVAAGAVRVSSYSGDLSTFWAEGAEAQHHAALRGGN